ncbi:YcaO-like protein with predicted kinase domain [Paenibacillus turicensis]|uniref:YcaO-like protein with predicted kinase domain n=1 Tax=Paenibacillus turicensis TaxID=160487 RepID=A0ABS4FSJ4_9BACL|nr:YcaO-like family protein [Paenibacillus turicensis]MBP1905535.1 YcaO-like protein with predicted kinase domain [Paenibacillus turicensis]
MENFERSVHVEEAIKVAEQFFIKHGVDISLQKKNSKNNLLCTYAVFDKSNKDNVELISSGKGVGKQALASALFEAIEHLLYLDNSIQSSEKAFINQIVNTNTKLLEFYPIYYLHKMQYEKELNVIKYENITKENNYLQYPSFLNCEVNEVDINLVGLKKYRTNSGCATGYSKEEAIIHGINEIVERDSLSTHLRNCFITKSIDTVNVVSPDSLNEKLKGIYYEVQNTLEEEIFLLDVTKYPEFPTYYAFLKKLEFSLPFKGSGTSLFSEYAIERTLLELLQHYHMHNNQNEKEAIITSALFSEYDKYYKAIKCNYDDFNIRYSSFNYNNYFEVLDLENLLQIIIELLSKYNFDVYINQIYSSDNLFCVKVLIPGMDNFQIINNGILAVPNNSWIS